MERLHICIDCGGSKTSSSLAAFSTTPVILARGAAGPSNYKDNGLVIFLNAIRTATLSALSQALAGESVELPTVENVLNSSQIITESHKKYLYSAWIGASGVDSATDIGTLEPLLSRLLGIPLEAQRLVIANDAHIFASPLLATPESINHAVVAIAGTGSVVISFRRQPSSIAPTQEIVQLARAGGWGFLLGDEGSGFAAGREAIREVLRRFNAQDLEDAPSPSDKNGLTSILLNHFQLSSPDELFSVVYAPDVPSSSSSITAPWARMERKQRIVSLAPLVFHAAFTLHDDAALTALRNSVRGLASQIAGLSIQKKGSSSGKRVPAESSILVVGGSLLGVAEYRRLLVEELASLDRVFSNVVFVEDAAREGSLGLANLFR